MAKEGKLTGLIQFRVDPDLERAIKALSVRRGEELADLCRRILREAVCRESLEDGADAVAKIVRQVMRDVLKPTEERLAKINAKTAIMSGTAVWMSRQVLEEAGYDTDFIYAQARKKAVAFLQEREGETL
jgi:hypothetical protein